ncbi:hypothetical protein E1B28_007844 [Marasmius oreades]|uniref:Uncharacterized protein n=1 Tax=Marasmius oreades TaxID=181124 RepID=A0A9P7S2D9_9AGAR|nr:uncharacterized protein E1B28_007844 [Marasmius oreades]KAG7094239.1 hypothetical protein E1B28_007844 [Marasmius oreades]
MTRISIKRWWTLVSSASTRYFRVISLPDSCQPYINGSTISWAIASVSPVPASPSYIQALPRSIMNASSDPGGAVAPFISAEGILTQPIATLSVTFFLYGIYSAMFGLSIHVLFRRNSNDHKLYTGCAIALFTLATIYTSIETWGVSRQTFIGFHSATTGDYAPLVQYLKGDDRRSAWNAITAIVSNLMNSLAASMLIHRCYVIFDSNKFVIFPLSFVACVLNVIDFGCIIAMSSGFGGDSKPYNDHVVSKSLSIHHGVAIGIVVFQVLLTLITGGRIWWITRKARQLKEGPAAPIYNDVLAIMIESGLLYAATLLAMLVLKDALDPTRSGLLPLNFVVISTLVSGLAPTMVIARVAYGKSVDSVEQTLSAFRVAEVQTSQQRSIGTRRTTVDLQIRTQRDMSHNLHVEEPSVILTAVNKEV